MILICPFWARLPQLGTDLDRGLFRPSASSDHVLRDRVYLANAGLQITAFAKVSRQLGGLGKKELCDRGDPEHANGTGFMVAPMTKATGVRTRAEDGARIVFALFFGPLSMMGEVAIGVLGYEATRTHLSQTPDCCPLMAVKLNAAAGSAVGGRGLR